MTEWFCIAIVAVRLHLSTKWSLLAFHFEVQFTNAWHGLKTQIKQIEKKKRIKEKREKNGLHERMEKKSIIRRSLVNRD